MSPFEENLIEASVALVNAIVERIMRQKTATKVERKYKTLTIIHFVPMPLTSVCDLLCLPVGVLTRHPFLVPRFVWCSKTVWTHCCDYDSALGIMCSDFE